MIALHGKHTLLDCLLQSPWDFLALAIFMLFACAGFFWLIEDIAKLIDKIRNKWNI